MKSGSIEATSQKMQEDEKKTTSSGVKSGVLCSGKIQRKSEITGKIDKSICSKGSGSGGVKLKKGNAWEMRKKRWEE